MSHVRAVKATDKYLSLGISSSCMKGAAITRKHDGEFQRRAEEPEELKEDASDLLRQVRDSLEDLRHGRVSILASGKRSVQRAS